MTTARRRVHSSYDAERLRQALLRRARTLLFANPRLAEECRQKALMLLRIQGMTRLRRRA